MADTLVEPKDDIFQDEYVSEDVKRPISEFAAALAKGEPREKTPEEKATAIITGGTEKPAPKADKPTEKPVEKPTHSIESIHQARQMGIPAEEIDAMSPDQLKKTVTYLANFGQKVYDHWSSEQAAKVTKTEPTKEEDPFDALDADAYDPALIKVMKAVAGENKSAKAELAALKAELIELKKGHQEVQGQSVRQRLESLADTIIPGISSQFKGAAGQEKYDELLTAMRISVDHEKASNRLLDEPTRLRRALRMLDLAPQAKPEEVAKKTEFDKAAAAYDAGALGVPTARNTEDDMYATLKKKRKEWEAKREAEPIDDDENVFLPG